MLYEIVTSYCIPNGGWIRRSRTGGGMYRPEKG